MKPTRFLALALIASSAIPILAADSSRFPPQTPQPQALKKYFDGEVGRIEGQLEREVKTKEDWLAKKDEYRRQLAEMLGLDPMPPRTDLHATKTGEFESDGIVVEKLHYESMPGLFVTADLYRPKKIDQPLPTILISCGHSHMARNGIVYGNKTGDAQDHGQWYAKHGFVCMVIDTVELGEIRGEHHGLYNLGRWWWLSRGYTPAGVEAWAGIRGLDYLQTRSDVDPTRFGATGRSGGGASTWWIAALDERVKAAVPTAGITDLRNYVVDGCIEGHCDCMFFFNTYRWDYDKVAALVAPRALCVANTDKDAIFPLDGVYRVYEHARRIYSLLGAEANIGIQIAEGPHADTQPLNTGEYHWMTRFLQGAERMAAYDTSAPKPIDIEKLKVFAELPKVQRNSTIDESFVPAAPAPAVANNREEWTKQREAWTKALKEKVFAGWPGADTTSVKAGPSYEKDGIQISTQDLVVQDFFPLRVVFARRAGLKPQDLDLVVLNVLDQADYQEFAETYCGHFPELFAKGIKPDQKMFAEERAMFQSFKWGMAYVCPRGIGEAPWDDPAEFDVDHPKAAAVAKKARTQRLRRFYLVGQTLAGQQVWDIRCAIHALRTIDGLTDKPLWLQASREQAGNALYASLFEDQIARLDLHGLSHSHHEGPIYLNVLKYLDVPQAAAMAAERSRVVIYDSDKAAWNFTKDVSDGFAWGADKKHGLQIRDVPKGDAGGN
ncbi:MAG TPA: prolyl oligopeptidase family serine peptidase [Tepidisphaeraceae bacterium]|nr:prolyl oligopeptidase family serine peptidase [Tepidisphaeraceae bacterium]